ncbi:hypothetical protein GCM10008944_20720 [Cytobacillus oceanisediminis]
MTSEPKWSPDPAGVYFSDYFGVSPEVLEEYGALDISLHADLPLFIDPFLAFNSTKVEHQALHNQIIDYLRFLRDKAGTSGLTDGLIKNLYSFKEVKQNWLGFTVDGNDGKGLGPSFARSLHSAVGDVLGNFGNETITESSHLEKVALIQDGVGRDNISDFTTNLIKHYLLKFTAGFAKAYLTGDQVKTISVPRSVFNYTTETWATETFALPWVGERPSADGRLLPADYVLLSPLDLLTKDDTWINQGDMVARFDHLPDALSNDQTRAQVDNYFNKVLATNPSPKETREARIKTLKAFPELVDHYIALKEDDRDQAVAQAFEKTLGTIAQMRDQVQALAADLRAKTDLFADPWSSYDEAKKAVATFKDYVEKMDGYKLLNPKNGTRLAKEADVHLFFGLLLQPSRFDVNREPNNGRGPVDFKVSAGAFDKTLIEFKLASSTSLKRNLLNQVEIYLAANNTLNAVKVVVIYTSREAAKVKRVLDEIDDATGQKSGTAASTVVVIDARSDNKVSASKA